MSNQEYFSIYDEFHSEHCACYLRVKWDVQMTSEEDGYMTTEMITSKRMVLR